MSEIELHEEKLREAMLAGNVEQLDELIADASVFTNQDGLRLSKTDDIAAHRSGLLKVDKLDVRGVPLIRLLNESAIVCITVEVAGTYDEQSFGGVFAYSRLWHRTGGKWQIEAAHCSRMKDE